MIPTLHAGQRANHRGIPANVISAIYAYGLPSHHRGALALGLDREALDLAEDNLPLQLGRDLRRYGGVFAIVCDATVITVARPTRRHRT
jgi:hypothetical protein